MLTIHFGQYVKSYRIKRLGEVKKSFPGLNSDTITLVNDATLIYPVLYKDGQKVEFSMDMIDREDDSVIIEQIEPDLIQFFIWLSSFNPWIKKLLYCNTIEAHRYLTSIEWIGEKYESIEKIGYSSKTFIGELLGVFFWNYNSGYRSDLTLKPSIVMKQAGGENVPRFNIEILPFYPSRTKLNQSRLFTSEESTMRVFDGNYLLYQMPWSEISQEEAEILNRFCRTSQSGVGIGLIKSSVCDDELMTNRVFNFLFNVYCYLCKRIYEKVGGHSWPYEKDEKNILEILQRELDTGGLFNEPKIREQVEILKARVASLPPPPPKEKSKKGKGKVRSNEE